MLTTLYVKAMVGMQMSPMVAVVDPFPARCELYNAAIEPFAFVGGNIRGVLPIIAFIVLLICAGALIVLGKRGKDFATWFAIALVSLLAVGSLGTLVFSVAANSCAA